MDINKLASFGDDTLSIEYIFHAFQKHKYKFLDIEKKNEIDECLNSIEINKDNFYTLEKEIKSLLETQMIDVLTNSTWYDLLKTTKEFKKLNNSVKFKKMIGELHDLYEEMNEFSDLENTDEYIMCPYFDAIENINDFSINGINCIDYGDNNIILIKKYFIYDIPVEISYIHDRIEVNIGCYFFRGRCCDTDDLKLYKTHIGLNKLFDTVHFEVVFDIIQTTIFWFESEINDYY